MNLERMVVTQRVRIEELEEELRQMREAVVPQVAAFPIEWKLTPAQTRILSAFAKTPFLSHEKCFLALALNRQTEADNLVKVQIVKLRKKIAPLGMSIANRWGLGYEMTAESVAKLRSAIGL